MKHLKCLALVAAAAGALMASIGAGAASATVLCSTTADPCPSGQKVGNVTFDFSLASGSIKLVDTGGNNLDECPISTLHGDITNSGSSTSTVTGTVTNWTWGGCTSTTNTLSRGNIEIHKIAGTSNGTLTADGPVEVTIETGIIGSCVYLITTGTDIGELTEGNPAILHVNAVVDKVSGTFCPSSGKMTGTYTLTEPSNTTLSVSSS